MTSIENNSSVSKTANQRAEDQDNPEDEIINDELESDENDSGMQGQAAAAQLQIQTQQKTTDSKQQTQQNSAELKIYHDFKDFPHTKWAPYDDPLRCPAGSYTDARNYDNSQVMEMLLREGALASGKPFLFDLQNMWLKGEQYAHILQNRDRYCQVFAAQKYGQKQHPESIYIDPQDGLTYFVEGASIGSDFGFPRLGIRKRFKWKKMNFTTDLPKKDPLVSYIVASAVKCEKFFPGSVDDGPVYRMHAVILKKSDPRLQLPLLSATPKKESAQSQESDIKQESQQKQQLQSRSGRVITKSSKLKTAEQSKQEIISNTNQNNNINASAANEKNYILCHVRRVVGKGEEEEGDSVKHYGQSIIENKPSSNSKIPNKTKENKNNVSLGVTGPQVSSASQKQFDKKAKLNVNEAQLKYMNKVDAQGNPKKLTYYMKKKLLQQQSKEDEQEQPEQPPSKPVEVEKQIKNNEKKQEKMQTTTRPGTKRPAQEHIDTLTGLQGGANGQNEGAQNKKQNTQTQLATVSQNREDPANPKTNQNSKQQVQDFQLQQNLQQILMQNEPAQLGSNSDQQAIYLQALNNLNSIYGINNNLGLAGAINNLGVGNLNNLNNFGQLGPVNAAANQLWLNNNQNLTQQAAVQLAAQNQLLGLGSNIGPFNNLNGLAAAGLGNLGNLANLNNFQGLGNINNLININGLGNLNQLTNLQNLQAGLLGQNAPLVNLQNQNGSNPQPQDNIGTPLNQESKQDSIISNKGTKKREQKQMKKFDTSKLGENNLSPHLNLGNIGSLISGSNPGGFIVGGKPTKRKLTSDEQQLMPEVQQNSLAGLADNLVKECRREMSRRLSGQYLKNNNDEQQTEWEQKSNKLMTSVNNFIGEQAKRKMSTTNSQFGRDLMSCVFRQYDNKGGEKNNEKQVTKKSPLLQMKQGEPSFGVCSKAGSGDQQNASSKKPSDADKIQINKNIEPQEPDNAAKATTEQQDPKATDENTAVENENNPQSQQQIQQQFNDNLQAALQNGQQFYLMNPNFSANQNQGQLKSNMQEPAPDGGEQQQSTIATAAAQQLQIYKQQQQQILQQQQQLNQLNYLNQLQMLGTATGGNSNQQLNQLNQLQLFGPNNINDLLLQQQLLSQQQSQVDKDGKNLKADQQQQINQQINIIQTQKILPVLGNNGVFLNQNFCSNSNNKQSNQNKLQGGSADESPNKEKPQAKPAHDNKPNAFIKQIQNALAANPSENINDLKKDPSFTIHVPNKDTYNQKDSSWFGSFGALKSNEVSPNLGGLPKLSQTVESGNLDFSCKHKFSLTNAILNSMKQNKTKPGQNNHKESVSPSGTPTPPDRGDDSEGDTSNVNDKLKDLKQPRSLQTPGQFMKGQNPNEQVSSDQFSKPALAKYQSSQNPQQSKNNKQGSRTNQFSLPLVGNGNSQQRSESPFMSSLTNNLGQQVMGSSNNTFTESRNNQNQSNPQLSNRQQPAQQ